MKIVTDRIHPDEPCHGLFEGPEQGRWIQKVFVVRGDAIAQYRTDLGPEKDYEKVTPLVMPSFGDDTVAELQAHAEKNRHDHYWYDRREEMLSKSTLIQDAVDLQEQRNLEFINKSVLGPMVKVQRNAFSPQSAARILKERLRGKRN